MKITLDSIVSGFKSVTKLISNFDKIEDDLNNKVLYRDNPEGEPNQMQNDLDMNSQRIVNLVSPVNDSEPARWADVKNGVTGIDEPVPSQTGNAKTPLTTNGTGLVFGQIEADHVDFTNSGTGGVERTLQAKLEDVVNVKDFGAVGDGVTDDTAAINAASTFAVDNNKILVCDGIAALKGDWVIPDGLVFEAKGLTITRVSTQPRINNNVNIKGVTWDAQGSQTSLLVTGYNNWVLSDCHFNNAAKFGLEGGAGSPVEDFKLIRCSASNNGSSLTTEDSGIFLYGKRGLLFDCKANDNTGSGIVLRNSSSQPTVDVQFINCQAHRNTRHGFLTSIIDITPPWTRATGVKFVTCTANDNGDQAGFLYSGFALHELEDSDVIGCSAKGNGEHGITFQDGRYNRLVGGTFCNNNQSGLRVQGNFGRTEDSETGEQGSVFSAARLEGNGNVGVTSNTVNGVTIQANCQNNTYSNLRCTNNLEYGIRSQTKSSYSDNKNEIIDNCVLTGNGVNNDVKVDTNAALLRGSYYSPFGSDLVKKAVSGEQASVGVVPQDISSTGSSLGLISRGEIYDLSWSSASSTQITSISSAWEGHTLTLIFSNVSGGGVLSISNSGVIDLGNTLSSPHTVVQGDVLTFVRLNNVWKLLNTT